MSINPNLETFKALHEFSTYKGGPRDKLLKVAKDKDGREYLKFVPKKEFTLQERIASVSGKSAFNLANVLKVAENAAWNRGNEQIEGQNAEAILTQAATKLKKRVVTHYEKNPVQEAAVAKIAQIGRLCPTKAEILQKTKDAFVAELKSEDKSTFLREGLKPAYGRLHEMLETALKESGLVEIMVQQSKNKANAPLMLLAVVEHLERNPNPRIQEICEAIMTAVATRSSGVDAAVNDPAAFTAAAFILRQIPRFIVTLPKDQQKTSFDNLKQWQDQANNYNLHKAVEEPYKPLLDRLKVALIGDASVLKAALSDSSGRTEKLIEMFTTDSPFKAPLERICQKNHYSENFNFLNDFLAWKKNPSKEGAQDLITKYIKAGADSELNIGPNIHKRLQELMKDYEGNADAIQAQLQMAMNEVIHFLVPNILGAASGGK